MTKKKSKRSPDAAAPAKKMYLIRADDVVDFETFEDDNTRIACIHLKRGGRIVQIDDSPEGRGVLASNIRRIVGENATTRLIPHIDKSDKPV